MRNLQN